MIRGTAYWAIGQIQGEDAKALLMKIMKRNRGSSSRNEKGLT